jgi:Ca-activated chloride channel family protein
MFSDILHIDWNEFHFLRPNFLWTLVPVAITLIIGLFGVRDQVKWKYYIAPHLRPFMIKKGSERLKIVMQVLSFFIISIAVFGLAGPTWKKIELPERILETPLIILLDLSQSMMTDDIQPNRLERAKFKISDFLEANPKVRVGLVGFSGTAHTLVPLTKDYKIIESYLKNITTNVLPFQGTDLEAGLKLSDSLIKQTEAPGTIFLITDEFTEETFQVVQSVLTNNTTKLEIMPFGTSAGAPVPALGSKRSIKDNKGNSVFSALNQEIINKLGSLEQVNINSLTLDKSDVQLLAKTISKDLEFREKDDSKEENWQDEGWLFILPFAFFLLMWFRKGWVIYSLMFFMLFTSCKSDLNFKDLWLTDDFRAQAFYNEGKYKEAGALFTQPLRKGIAYYKSEMYYDAIEAFSQDTTAQGQYNLGLAYYKVGEINLAQMAFKNANALDATMTAAANNLAITQKLISENQDLIEEAEEFKEEEKAENIKNTDPEDLGGGGQEATEEDMKKERKEETVETDTRKGKELDEVPDDFEGGKQDNTQKVLMRKVDDDPSLFLKRKFVYQVKKTKLKPKENLKKW